MCKICINKYYYLQGRWQNEFCKANHSQMWQKVENRYVCIETQPILNHMPNMFMVRTWMMQLPTTYTVKGIYNIHTYRLVPLILKYTHLGIIHPMGHTEHKCFPLCVCYINRTLSHGIRCGLSVFILKLGSNPGTSSTEGRFQRVRQMKLDIFIQIWQFEDLPESRQLSIKGTFSLVLGNS